MISWRCRRTYFRVRGFLLAAFFFGLALFGLVKQARAALDPSQVLILVNRDVPASARVATMYQKLRGVPADNVLRLNLGISQQITPEQYWSRTGPFVRKHLEAHAEIRCIVTTTGVPYTIQGPGDQGAAFDSELALVLREQAGEQKRQQLNPLYLNGENRYGLTDPRLLRMVFVARLDGPDLDIVTRMVEDAIETEKVGLKGLVAGDAQGIDGVTGYGEGDFSIRAAMDRFSGAGFATTMDMKQETWRQPKGGVGTQAAGAAFYLGWYALLDFQDIFGEQGLARGAIAWHIASQEAQDIWNPKSTGWCINLMRRGAAVTIGPVREPYVAAFPHGDIFVETLLRGMSVAEAYWLSLPHASWAMVILGDPLYRPFALKPRPSLLARAYLSGGPDKVLQKGETRSMLVQLECVGPAGTGVPALSATAEPEFGLAAASGSIAIPALKVGETTLVTVPSVTAGDDPSGMFRLRLKARAEGEPPRNIVLEGRIGFSRITPGLGPKSQMFIAPDGKALISGQPGVSALIQVDTLRSQAIRVPPGFGVAGAEFSPDASHIALSMLNPREKTAGAVITDAALGNVQPVPTGTQVFRWLAKDKILLKKDDRLISHDIAGSQDVLFDAAGVPTTALIPGTNIQAWLSEDGKLNFKKGDQPAHAVLPGVSVRQFTTIAPDLSFFGGVDGSNQLWVQRGLAGTPQMVAAGVSHVMWTPSSRRAVVQDSQGHSRIFDSQDGHWTDLGSITGAVWSPTEESLLLVGIGKGAETEGDLAISSAGSIRILCPMSRIGQVGGASFTKDGKKVFLLATLSSQADVWMVSLAPAEVAPAGK